MIEINITDKKARSSGVLSLDKDNTDRILKSLIEINSSMGTSIILISHNQSLKSITDQIINL